MRLRQSRRPRATPSFLPGTISPVSPMWWPTRDYFKSTAVLAPNLLLMLLLLGVIV